MSLETPFTPQGQMSSSFRNLKRSSTDSTCSSASGGGGPAPFLEPGTILRSSPAHSGTVLPGGGPGSPFSSGGGGGVFSPGNESSGSSMAPARTPRTQGATDFDTDAITTPMGQASTNTSSDIVNSTPRGGVDGAVGIGENDPSHQSFSTAAATVMTSASLSGYSGGRDAFSPAAPTCSAEVWETR